MKPTDIHPNTVVVNKTQQAASKKSRHETLNWLANTFPKAFDTTLKVQPLKIGIINDILAHIAASEITPCSKSKLREALVVFTRRIDYLASMKTRNMRIDLQGNPVASITPEEAEQAATKIKKHIEKTMQQRRGTPSAQTSSRASTSSNTTAQKTPATIKLKKRSPDSYDPHAVARLKEKLGLKREQVEFS